MAATWNEQVVFLWIYFVLDSVLDGPQPEEILRVA
jgi:hypothetical protein